MTHNQHCLINQEACGREAGKPICPKCGMDERVFYPGQSDLEGAITAAKARFWEAHARQLETQYAQVVVDAVDELESDADEIDAEPLGLLVPSPDLAAIVGSKPLGRTEVTKQVWAYIKKNKLQDSINKRMINADAKLRKLFNKPQVSMFELPKILNKHLKPSEPSSGLPDGVTKLNPAAAWPFPTQSQADVPAPEEPEAVRDDELREKTLKRIRNGWIVAAISALLTLFLGVVGPTMDINPLDIDASAGEHWYMLIDVALVVALGFGVYRKNRWAAAALFAYFLLSKISMSIEYETPRPLIQGVVFSYFYFMGMWGCFTWHKHFAKQAAWPFPTSNTP